MDDVAIDEITFNHDQNSHTSDALTIRMNEKDNVQIPEWKAGRDSFPAAYACSQGNAMKIAVRLKRLNPNVQSVELSAQSDRLLGAVKAKKPVSFPKDKQCSEIVMLDLNGATIAEAGVDRWDVSFRWTLIADTKPGKEIFNDTSHVVYTLLERPNPPWGTTAEDLEPPWAEMLELVCPWAAGARNRIKAASMITEKLYKLGHAKKLRFDENMSFSRFALNGTDRFDLRNLLARLKNPNGTEKVNCTDCAILVSSFANLLGCDLYQSQMGYDFLTNQIHPIGTDWKGKEEFEYHEVAWEDPCKDGARLFDCFLEVDGNPRTTAANEFEAVLPVNMPFRDARDGGYHFRLVQPESKCEADNSTKIRRKIARDKDKFAVHSSSSRLTKLLAERFRFSDWKDLPFTQPLFNGPIDKLNEKFLWAGWHRVHLKEFEGEKEVLELRDSVWQSNEAADTAVRLLTYRCESVPKAMAFLLNLLGGFQIAGMVPRVTSQTTQGPFVVGDLAFSNREDQTILFLRSNVVVFLQNAGSNSISLLSIARGIDQEIRNVLDPAQSKLKEKT